MRDAVKDDIIDILVTYMFDFMKLCVSNMRRGTNFA